MKKVLGLVVGVGAFLAVMFGMLWALWCIAIPISAEGTAGVIHGKGTTISAQDEDDALRTGPVAYDMKKLVGKTDTTVTVISTKWTPPSGYTYVCRGFYNSSATATIVKVRTVASTDTIPIRVGAYGITPFTFPFIHTIYKLNAGDSVGVGTDTIIPILQITK